MNSTAVFVAVFLACAVESVEAATVVLAMGTSREWRSTLTAVAGGLTLLAFLVAVLGPAITALPLEVLQLVVGAVLLIFGLQWLCKAVLRAGGRKALRDEDAAFRQQVAAAQSAVRQGRGMVHDCYAFTVVFKSVVLEGLEVVFIAVSVGATEHAMGTASLAAVTAVVAVAAAAAMLRVPLARVPENAAKFVVGVLLCAFGTFWAGEGVGVSWPGGESAIPLLIGLYAVAGMSQSFVLRMRSPLQT